MRSFKIIKDDELVKYNLNKEDIVLPKRQTIGSCGYDFYLPYDITIKANSIEKVYTGIKCELPVDEFLMVCIRSSMATKKGLVITNQVGIIDSDYFENPDNDGHIIVSLRNTTNNDINLVKGDRIAQGIIFKYQTVDDEDVTNKRSGGFGSTNK